MKRREVLKYGAEAGAVTLLGFGVTKTGAFTGDASDQIRPPGALPGTEYLKSCIKCGRCIQACPVDALGFAEITEGIGQSGTPKLVPEVAGCIAWDEPCLDCIEVCPTDALSSIPTDENGFPSEEVIARAQIDDERCINCDNCYPICPVDAVLTEGEKDRPTYSIDYEDCIGCGRCIEICPVEGEAIELFGPSAKPEYPISMAENND